MYKLKPIWMTGLFTTLHFLVDGICGLVIASSLVTDDINQALIVYVIYNFLAFCTQPLVGFVIDKYKNKERLFLIIAIVFLLLGVVFKFQYIAGAILLGIGNSFFHVSGGKYVISKTNNDIVSLGIFVATGALGLAIGTYIHHAAIWISFITITIIVTLIVVLSKDTIEEDSIVGKKTSFSLNWLITLSILVVTVVFIRSYIGKVAYLPFDKPLWVLIAFGGVAMLGKMLGGILAKYIGINITIISTMILSMICLIFFYDNVYLALIGLLLFNCSMPLTLYLMNELLKGSEGFAFGLLAAFLAPAYFLGAIPTSNPKLVAQICIAIGCILSIVMVIITNYKLSKERGN